MSRCILLDTQSYRDIHVRDKHTTRILCSKFYKFVYTFTSLCLHINHAFFFVRSLGDRYDHTACNSRAWQKYGLKTRRKRIHHCMIEFLCRDVRRFSYTIVNVMIIITVWNNRKFSVVYNRRIGMRAGGSILNAKTGVVADAKISTR